MSKFDSQLTDVTLSQLKVLLEQLELEVTLIALTGTQEIPSGALTFLRSSPRELMTSCPLSESAYGYIYISIGGYDGEDLKDVREWCWRSKQW